MLGFLVDQQLVLRSGTDHAVLCDLDILSDHTGRVLRFPLHQMQQRHVLHIENILYSKAVTETDTCKHTRHTPPLEGTLSQREPRHLHACQTNRRQPVKLRWYADAPAGGRRGHWRPAAPAAEITVEQTGACSEEHMHGASGWNTAGRCDQVRRGSAGVCVPRVVRVRVCCWPDTAAAACWSWCAEMRRTSRRANGKLSTSIRQRQRTVNEVKLARIIAHEQDVKELRPSRALKSRNDSCKVKTGNVGWRKLRADWRKYGIS